VSRDVVRSSAFALRAGLAALDEMFASVQEAMMRDNKCKRSTVK